MGDDTVAVLGAALRFPGAQNTEELWANLRDKRVCTRRYDAAALRAKGADPGLLTRPNFVPVDGTLPDAGDFAAGFFGYSQREAELMDPQHRLLLECAWELLQRIGYGTPQGRPTVGVFAGASMNTYLPNLLQRKCDLSSLSGTELMLTNDKDYLTSRLSYKLGLSGPSVVVQTGCSTSLVAVHMAVQSLLSGECDIALAGGVSVHVGDHPGYFHEPGLIFSPDGMCRPFDAHGDGTVFSDGVGLVALRRLGDAVDARDPIRAVVLGSASNNDGAARAGFTAPSVEGQRELLGEALAVADVLPTDLGMIEAHGTATKLGDPIEFAALREVFESQTAERGICALGAVKANLGHLAGAAGIAGFIKAMLAVEHGEIPPHATFTRPHPQIDLDASPLFINTSVVPWPRSGPRRAGVTALGVGGSNAHVVLEQAPAPVPRARARGWHVVPISAPTHDALEAVSGELAGTLQRDPAIDPADVAFTLSCGREPLGARRVVVGRTTAELAQALARSSPPEAAASRLVLALDDKPLTWIVDPICGPDVQRGLAALQARWPGPLTVDDLVQDGEPGPRRAALRLVSQVAGIAALLRVFGQATAVVAFDGAELAAACALGSCDLDAALAYVVDGAPRPSHGYRRPLIESDDLVVVLAQGPASSAVRAAGATVLPVEPVAPDGPSWVSRTVAAVWSRGLEVRWAALDPESSAGRVTVPVPALDRRRCWAEPSTPTPVVAAVPPVSNDPAAWLYRETWVRARPIVGAAARAEDATVLVFAGHCAAAQAVLATTRGQAARVVCVKVGSQTQRTDDGYNVDPSEPNALSRLLSEDGIVPDRVVHTWTLDLDADAPQAQWLDRGPHALLELAQGFPPGSRMEIDVATHGLFDVLGGEDVIANAAPLLGVMRVLPQEMPWLRCCVVDLGPGETVIPGQRPAQASAVATRRGHLWVQRFETLQGPGAPVEISPGGVCLVTGGLGHVGLALGEHLASRSNATLVLTTRSEFPGHWRTLEGLAEPVASRVARLRQVEERGVAVHVVQADATCRQSMARAISEVSARFGPIRSFVHAAGLPAEQNLRWVAKSDRAQWAEILAPKLAGAAMLHELCASPDLQLGCFVSSLAAVAGGLGHASYAAANRFLDGFVQQHRDMPYFVVDWEGWSTWEAAENRRAAWALSPQEADAAFGLALAHAASRRIAVSRIALQPRMELTVQEASSGDRPVPNLESESAEDLLARMVALWSEVLRASVDPGASFFDIGGDSLLGAELVRQVNDAFGVKLSLPDLFAAPSVASMVELLRPRSDDAPRARKRRRRARVQLE